MSTLKQEKLAKNIVDNLTAVEPLNKQELAVKSGYATNTADDHVDVIFDSVGLKRALWKLGFNSDNAKRVVAEIMNDETAENKDRLKAAEHVFKVIGDYAPEKSLNVNVEIETTAEVAAAAEVINEYVRQHGSLPRVGDKASPVDSQTQDKK